MLTLLKQSRQNLELVYLSPLWARSGKYDSIIACKSELAAVCSSLPNFTLIAALCPSFGAKTPEFFRIFKFDILWCRNLAA